MGLTESLSSGSCMVLFLVIAMLLLGVYMNQQGKGGDGGGLDIK